MVCRKNRGRAVSEIVGILLATLVVISIGTVFILRLKDVQASWSSVIQNLIGNANYIKTEPNFGIVYSYLNITSNSLDVFLNIAPGTLTISSIYINGYRINQPQVTILVDGQPVAISQSGEFSLLGGDAHRITILLSQSQINQISSQGTNLLIKIVSKAGIEQSSTLVVLS
ncbi:MAG: hypothetical protein QW039_05975 [Fervidicoccaceae archaeon]